jgi:hypothetical protein
MLSPSELLIMTGSTRAPFRQDAIEVTQLAVHLYGHYCRDHRRKDQVQWS